MIVQMMAIMSGRPHEMQLYKFMVDCFPASHHHRLVHQDLSAPTGLEHSSLVTSYSARLTH